MAEEVRKSGDYWKEENVTGKVQATIEELFKGREFNGCNVDTVEVRGEATANLVRSKYFLIFDYYISLHWKGNLFDETSTYGTVSFVIDQDSSEPDKYRIYFQPGKDTIEHRKIKDLTRKESINMIKVVLSELSSRLTEDYKCTVPVGVLKNSNNTKEEEEKKTEEKVVNKKGKEEKGISEGKVVLAIAAAALAIGGGLLFYHRYSSSNRF